MDAGTQTVVTGTISAAAAAWVTWLAYRRSRKVDAVAEQSGVATETRAGTAQIIEGMMSLIAAQREDNKALRETLKEQDRVAVERERECGVMQRELNRLNRRYGNNGEVPDGA